ncbi:hypothetical protein [Xenorhabdus lircayensis]|uniref:Uncharacterized protein n=1 Tax=Xenorhabdus lircayensis TaxID=2763499 RepID=A0ABS0U8B4_9GAMM|nr:hypothetical protein [Xenorhabdus lircayensis]MBI6550124.1 hypothetical protein [Xenorhabdus lircayensis]
MTGTLLAGLFFIIVQLLLPFATTITPNSQKGKNGGIMIGGLLLVILSAKTIAGLLNGWLGVVIASLAICIINLGIWFYMHKYEKTKFHSNGINNPN